MRRRFTFSTMVMDLVRNPTVLISEVFVVVVISVIFEQIEHSFTTKLKYRDRFSRALMNVLFKEITLVGFVCFTLFMFLHSGLAERLAWDVSIASFESVRMLMFMVVNVLLAQAAAMWLGGQRIVKEWGKFERARSFGTSKNSMESRLTQGGYLKRVPDPEAHRGTTLLLQRPLKAGSNMIMRLALRRNKLRKLLNFRAIRHEFLFPSVKNVPRVPDPGVFSFETYLRMRLGKCLIALITVDTQTWLSTLILLAPPLYFVKMMSGVFLEAALCAFAWALVLAGLVLVCTLEEDLHRLTPQVPEDLRLTLKLLNGESLQMLRRKNMPSWRDRSLSGRRFRPGLGDAEGVQVPPLGRAPAMRSLADGGCSRLFSPKAYEKMGRLLMHFQAISVATLIVANMAEPPGSRLEWVLYGCSWLAWWPMLKFILPLILRRITMLSSIEIEKDERAIRIATLELKDFLLRDFRNLVLLMRFEARAMKNGEAWTRPGDSSWGRREKVQAVYKGNKLFESQKEEIQSQIRAVFAGWDPQNNGYADLQEVEEVFKIVGFAGGTERAVAAANLLRMVDFDNTGELNWMKFKAIFGLATVQRPEEEVNEDLRYFFKVLDTNEDQLLSLFELADGFKRMHISVDAADLENLTFLFYGEARPQLDMDQFVDFITADHRMTAIRSVYQYSETH